VIGSSVKLIDFDILVYGYAYGEKPSAGLQGVYYKGTEEDWLEIEVRSDNYALLLAPRYYYSEVKPAEEGKYWHYDEKGEITVW
jgi:hypothetical protein